MTEHEPWSDNQRLTLSHLARQVAYSHGSHADQVARDNCGACALRKSSRTQAPDYAGWLRLWIALGWPVLRNHFDTEIAFALRENPAYHDAIMRDIATWGVTCVDTQGAVSR